jgi:DnaJ-class molecular chaperone
MQMVAPQTRRAKPLDRGFSLQRKIIPDRVTPSTLTPQRSHQSTPEVSKKGTSIEIQTETVACASCRDIWTPPMVTCSACDGRGKVVVAKPARICPRCGGTGAVPRKDAIDFGTLACPVCRGIGWALVL